MGAQIEAFARHTQSNHREDADNRAQRERVRRKRTSEARIAATPRQKTKPSPAEELQARADEALSHLPTYVQTSLAKIGAEPAPAIRTKRAKDYPRINGVIVARGFEPQTMALGTGRAGGRLRMEAHDMRDPSTGENLPGLVSALLDAEQWAEAKNAPQATETRKCRETLLRMIDSGDGDLVVILFLMYGQSIPASEFPKLDDLAPLVLDTPTVLRHAEKMTNQLCASLVTSSEDKWAHARLQDRRETVTPRTALHDLLDKRSKESPERAAQREHVACTIKTEAGRLLICASSAYLRAKAEAE